MSGICGICEPGRSLSPAGIKAMLAALSLPDETGQLAPGKDSVALGVSQRWHFQQVASIPGVRIAADAELFNRQELTKSLQGGTYDPACLTSAELLARLYRERGVSFVELLDGVFSFALWDEVHRRLVLAIDRLGVNSLYWRKEGDRILFASRVGAIRSTQEAQATVNPAALVQYMLFSAVPAPMVIYQGIEKIRPGFCLVYEAGQIRQTRYWDLEYRESDNRDVAHWAHEVREGMRSAVHRQLADLAPENTGAYLSGGTDSSSVVAFMNEYQSPVNTYSIFFAEAVYSEVGFARTTAKHFRANHHELSLTSRDTYDAIPKIMEYYDEPFANSSAIGAYHCARMARESGVTTLLAGDGGDELFAGNERYATDKRFALYQQVPAWLRKGVIEPIAALLPQNESHLSLPRRYVRRANIPLPRRIFSYHLLLSTPPEEMFEQGLLESAPPETWLDVAEGHFRSAVAESDLNRLLYLDVKMTLADNDLRKVLGTAELAGVRARFPLLDYTLAELSGRVPAALKMRGFEKRFIFKEAMREILPHNILYKKKHGFGVPVALWFLQDPRLETLVADVLTDSRTRQRGYFRPAFLDHLLRLHRGKDAHFYGEILWYLVALELWHRQHLERSLESVCAD
ncbi:MAG TPA: asparagine synthase (glutamine-hydrolyzing) [Candidatus Limnocylindria bacterium]|jgi:asparagine synthase (glutamine-hydrolysing)|nr:asparagine synthase (glutamine-hydrolyzing) [Candidatus Limnocylindria bacterium]